jgi:hypothetical protein
VAPEQVHRLEPEGGERRKPAAKSGYEKQPDCWIQLVTVLSEAYQEPYQPAAKQVDDECAHRKPVARRMMENQPA